MNELSLEYAGLVRRFRRPLDPTVLGAELLEAVAERYEVKYPDCALHLFEQSGAAYLFDLASSADLVREDRTFAAWTLTPRAAHPRDAVYQRGFPMAPGTDDAPVDRGRLIPHLSGGEFGPNLFRHARALNRGWSEQGKGFRALEREAAATPNIFYFGT